MKKPFCTSRVYIKITIVVLVSAYQYSQAMLPLTNKPSSIIHVDQPTNSIHERRSAPCLSTYFATSCQSKSVVNAEEYDRMQEELEKLLKRRKNQHEYSAKLRSFIEISKKQKLLDPRRAPGFISRSQENIQQLSEENDSK